MSEKIAVDGWVEMFREVGLTEEQMHEWHRLFETRFPDSHQEFLTWLGLPEERIEKIRAAKS